MHSAGQRSDEQARDLRTGDQLPDGSPGRGVAARGAYPAPYSGHDEQVRQRRSVCLVRQW